MLPSNRDENAGYLNERDKRNIKASLGSAIPAIILTSPLEIIKMNAQVTSGNITIRGMVKDVFRNHGIRGFYKGLGVSLCGQPMFWALYHPIKNNLHDNLANDDGSIDFWAKSSTIFAASLGASVTVNPLFVVKTRFQTSVLMPGAGSLRYLEMIKNIFRNEGIGGFYKGNFVAQIKNTQLVPQMLLYEFIRDSSLNPLYDSNLFLIDRSFVSGVVAKTIASCIVYYPVDVIRTNIRHKTVHVSIPEVIKEVYRRPGGFLNFYRGVSVYWVSAIPTFGLITFGMNKLQIRLKD